MLVLALVGLLGTNLATLLSGSAHDFLYTGLRKAILLVSTAAAERMTRRSKAAEVQAKAAEVKVKAAEVEAAQKENSVLREQKAKAEAHAARVQQDLTGERAKTTHLTKSLDEAKSARTVDAKTAKEVAERVQGRLAKGVIRNVAAIPAESIPFIGIAVTVSMTALDLYDACETMKEINELLVRQSILDASLLRLIDQRLWTTPSPTFTGAPNAPFPAKPPSRGS